MLLIRSFLIIIDYIILNKQKKNNLLFLKRYFKLIILKIVRNIIVIRIDR